MLTWSDGRKIVANGAEVHAFQSTKTQLVDPGLFNISSQWSGNNNWADDTGIVPAAWKDQFGEKNATTYLREIAGVSSSRDEFDQLVQRVSFIVGGGGISDVTWDLDAALALTGAPAVFRALLAKRLAAAGADAVVGAKETAAISSGAASVNAQSALRAKLSGLQKAQETAAVTKTLPDGRIRYYTQEVPARTEGVTRGASFATEYNPTTGSTRQWMESYDHSGSVIRVHPKSINGQPVSAQHYPPTGAELKSWE